MEKKDRTVMLMLAASLMILGLLTFRIPQYSLAMFIGILAYYIVAFIAFSLSKTVPAAAAFPRFLLARIPLPTSGYVLYFCSVATAFIGVYFQSPQLLFFFVTFFGTASMHLLKLHSCMPIPIPLISLHDE